MTEDEQQAKEEERRFLSAQPVEVQAADALTRELQTAFTANNPKRLADALASAVKAQVWKTGVVFYPSIPSRRKVVKYDSIYEWADAIHIDLDELVTLLAQRHDHVELVAPAVEAFFLEAVKDREKFFEYSQDRSESKPGWRKRIQMLVDYAAEWASTFALFESISTNSKGRPTKADP